MGMRRTYGAIREMVRRSLLTTKLSKDILRKSGFLTTGEGGMGIPRGGQKGYALVKRSDEDFDVEWQPRGPYVYYWNVFLPEHWKNPIYPPETLGQNDNRDSIYPYSIEPVPVMVTSWHHINQPLRSGVNHAGALGFEWDRWAFGGQSQGGAIVWTNMAKETTPLTDPGFKESTNPLNSFQSVPSHGFDQGSRGLHIGGVIRQFRLQGYVTRGSSQGFFEVAGVGSSDGGNEWWDLRHDISGPGYFDTGWIGFDFPARFKENTTSQYVFYGDPVEVDPAIAFIELQARLYEFPNHFDWLYARGAEPGEPPQ